LLSVLGLVVQGLGYIKDIFDSRDMPLEHAELSRDLPLSLLPSHDIGPLYQDGKSCVGASAAQAYRICETLAGRPCPELSAAYIYWGAKFLGSGNPERDSGSQVRNGIKALIKFGAPPASVWPMSYPNIFKRPTLKASMQAFDIRGVRGYYRIPAGDVDGIRTALASKCAVIGGFDIDRAFIDPKGPELAPNPRGPFVGGHAFVIDGYRADGSFSIQNSWRGWRGNQLGASRCFITEEFAAAGQDIWAVQT